MIMISLNSIQDILNEITVVRKLRRSNRLSVKGCTDVIIVTGPPCAGKRKVATELAGLLIDLQMYSTVTAVNLNRLSVVDSQDLIVNLQDAGTLVSGRPPGSIVIFYGAPSNLDDLAYYLKRYIILSIVVRPNVVTWVNEVISRGNVILSSNQKTNVVCSPAHFNIYRLLSDRTKNITDWIIVLTTAMWKHEHQWTDKVASYAPGSVILHLELRNELSRLKYVEEVPMSLN